MSAYLDGIINKQHGSTNATVVFLDIVKYSKRKSIIQQKVVQRFSGLLSQAIEAVSAKHISDSQKQNLNLSTDIIKIPTGDGAAVVFPFQGGLQNIHLDFALEFLNCSLSSRKDEVCELFANSGWCNCHDFLDVRVGVADGKNIVFKDINQNYNVAGNAINIASRVMGLADGQQIVFANDAYKNIIDMTEDTALESQFSSNVEIKLKHDLTIDVCQYIGSGQNYLNREPALALQIASKVSALEKSNAMFSSDGPPSPAQTLEHLEALEILKDMPMHPFAGMMQEYKKGTEKEKARAIVDVVKAISQFAGLGGVSPPPIVDVDKDKPDR